MPAKTPLAGDKIDAPAACAVPLRPYCGGVVMLVLAVCLVQLVDKRVDWMAGIGWHVKLYDPSLTRATHEHLGDEQLIIRCNTNKLAVSFKRWVEEGRTAEGGSAEGERDRG